MITERAELKKTKRNDFKKYSCIGCQVPLQPI